MGGWTEIRVDVPVGWQELVADALALGPCTSVAFGTTSVAARAAPEGHEVVRTFVAARDDTPELRARVAGLLAVLAARAGAPELAGLAPRFHVLPPEDYATSWRKSWRPFRVGRLVLLPPWRAEPPPRTSDVRLTIEPGGAFGSGRHATTRACLRVLDERIRGGERVLDAGSGSGVLSVAACLLGAHAALGFDVDPVAPPVARELAGANGVADRCAFRAGGFEVLGEGDGDFDVALANIYADVLEERAAELAARLAPGGWFCFSGCRIDHRGGVLARLDEVGLVPDEERRRGRWCTFVGRAPDAR